MSIRTLSVIYDIILRLVYTFSCSRDGSLCAYFKLENHVVILWQLLFNLRRRSYYYYYYFFFLEMIEIHECLFV